MDSNGFDGRTPAATYWTSVCIADEPDWTSWIHLYVSQTPWAAGDLDSLLRHVADDVIANVLITDEALRWLYHPFGYNPGWAL